MKSLTPCFRNIFSDQSPNPVVYKLQSGEIFYAALVYKTHIFGIFVLIEYHLPTYHKVFLLEKHAL